MIKQRLHKTWAWLQEKKRLQPVSIFVVLAALLLIFWIQTAKGAAYTWDGGGVDGTCGGAGTANNWSCAANWSSDITPSSSDSVTFDGTSTKNATINGTVTVAGMTITAAYSGIITQGSNAVTVSSPGYSQAGGTFTGGSGTIGITGAFTLSGGTFTSTSNTLTFTNASYTHTAGGTFSHGSGTVTMTGGTGGLTVDVASTETFNNFTIAKSGTTSFIIATGDTLIVTGTLAHNDGGFNTGTIDAQGAVTFASTADGSSGTLLFSVAGDQSITGGSGAQTGNLSITKPSGTVTLTGDLIIDAYTQTSGTFNAGTGNITVVSSAWTHTAGGTFTHGGGTVTFTGTTATVDVATTETFNNLNVNKSASQQFNITSGDTLVAVGTFTHTDGSVNTGTVEVQGSTSVISGADGGTATISYSVAGDQTITGTTSGSGLANINIAKSSGTVTVSGGVNFSSFTQSSGGFNGGTNNLANRADFTLSGGTFTSTSGTFTMDNGGEWTHTAGGTFTHNSGTVSFTSGGTVTADVATTELFHNLTIAKSTATILSIPAADTLVVEGTLTQTDGLFNTGTIEARGGVAIGASSDSGSGILSFLVAGDQTITPTTGGKTSNISVNKSSGTVSIANGQDLQATGLFVLSGTFSSTSGTLTLAGSNVTVYSHTSGTFTHNNGTVAFSITNNPQVIDVADRDTFYNLSFIGSSTTQFNFTAGDYLIALNTLTHSGGIINTATIDAQGNVVVGNVLASAGSGTITFLNGADQTITASADGELPKVTVAKSGGTLTASGTFKIDTFTLNSGTFVSTPARLQISPCLNCGGFAHTGGTFKHNNGEVEFFSGSGITNQINLLGATNFYDVEIMGSTSAITTADTLVVEHDFTHTSGAFNGAGVLSPMGNVSIATASASSVPITFAGTADQSFTATSGATGLLDGDITINKGAGKVTMGSWLTLNATNQDLTITSGTFDIGSNLIILSSGATGTFTIGATGMLRGVGSGEIMLGGISLTNNGTVYLDGGSVGCGDTDDMTMSSFSSGTQRSWNGTGKFFLTDVSVSDIGGSATIVATSSTNDGGNGANITFNATCPAAVTSPNGGESWDTRSSKSITFGSYAGADHYRLYYSTNSGASWTEIATTGSSPYAWTVPSVNSTRTRIMVAAENSGNTVLAQDLSDADFTIAAYGTTVNGGVIINGGVNIQ